MKVKNYQQVAAEPVAEAPGVTIRWLISEADEAPNFAMRHFEVEPGAATPAHTHPWEHEVFILSGQGVVRNEDREIPLSEGTVVYVAGMDPHQFINRSERETLRFLCVIPLPRPAP